MYEFLCSLIIQEEYIKAGILFISMIGIFLFIVNIVLIVIEKIILSIKAKKSLTRYLKQLSQ